MTNEEAIKLIEEFMVIDDWSLVYLPDLPDALELAIKALKRQHGEWNILQKDDNGIHEIECPFCKYSKGGRFASVGITFYKLPPFCEACGAAMGTKESKPEKSGPCMTCSCVDDITGCCLVDHYCEEYIHWKEGEENDK